MMQELVELQQTLFNVGVDAKSLYELKLHIIERNLHGVDIDPFAVNIAMLRLWLSLAIEFDGATPEPLPNLDFKIVEGDSLLGPDPSQISLDSHAIQQSELGALKANYLRETSGPEKERLKDQIEEAKQQITAQLGDAKVPTGAVDWRIDFAEIIAQGGFDVAIANPPYVAHDNINSAVKAVLKRHYSVWEPYADLYCFFIERTIALVRDSGVSTLITSNSYFRAQ